MVCRFLTWISSTESSNFYIGTRVMNIKTFENMNLSNDRLLLF